MKALVRFGLAAAAALLALAPAPLAAQETSPVAVTPSPSSENAVGPAQLRDFNLDGTVIRRAEPAPQRDEAAPPRQRPAATASVPTARTEPAPRAETQRQVAERQTQPRPEPAREAGIEPGSTLRDLPPPSPAAPLFSPAPVLPAADSQSDFAPAGSLSDEGGGFSPLPWLIAVLLLGGAAAYYFRTQRSGLALAGGTGVSEFAAPDPEPRPAPAPAPPARPTPPVGIVSTRLRPALAIDFKPDRLAIEQGRVTIEFQALVANNGNGPAREVLLEAAMFTAGPAQDQELGAFFSRPVGQGERIAMIPPLKSMAFRSAVNLPREHVRQYVAGDRTVFVPLIGFNLLFRWSGGEEQVSASYLIGIDTRGEKLAPFRLDQAPRIFAELGARQLPLPVRK